VGVHAVTLSGLFPWWCSWRKYQVHRLTCAPAAPIAFLGVGCRRDGHDLLR
jgi:hypothetical protein